MSGTELIVAALAAGAGAGITNTASAAVQDAYAELKRLLGHRLRDREQATRALEGDEVESRVWQAQIGDDLVASGVAEDGQVLAVAQRLLALLDGHAARYDVDLRGARGVQVGEHGTQTNNFH
ncbi:hypothetical protein [Micromonospora sp. IBHARD004]|uniref:hypothetical protein n=1 Tax=Micromonospora sp. IBHARD004 TaxID=3457764 RepID=UPI004058C8D7